MSSMTRGDSRWPTVRLRLERNVDVNIVAIGRRQVVVWPCDAVPALRIGIPGRVERHRVAQCVQRAVVEEVLSQRHVAQRRRPKEAAVFRPVLQIDAQRPAEPEIEERRVAIGREIAIARHRQRDVSEVGELRKVVSGTLVAARMAARAVALLQVVKGGQAALLGRGQLGLVAQMGVVLARERMELACDCSKVSSATVIQVTADAGAVLLMLVFEGVGLACSNRAARRS